MSENRTPVEQIDSFRWEKRSKIITRDVHGVGGLMNFTCMNRLAAEPPTPMHYHSGILEIHCIVKGRRSTRLYKGERMESILYTGGEALVVFPGEYHATGNERQQEPCELYAVQLNLREADDFLGLNRERGRALCRALETLPHRLLRLGHQDLAILRKSFELFSDPDDMMKAAGLSHLVCFLYRFVSLPPVETPLCAPSDARIRRVIDYIAENIAEPMNLTGLANLAGYSLSRFKTRFREETGQTPAVYITACKVERAKAELENTDKTVTDIAYNLGWSSGNYFCSVFKKLTGTSPLQYRKQFREEEE